MGENCGQRWNCKRKVYLHDDCTCAPSAGLVYGNSCRGNWKEVFRKTVLSQRFWGKESACHAGDPGDKARSLSWEDPLEKEMAIPLSILAGKIHEQWSLAGPCLWSHKDLGMTEHSHVFR